MRPKRVILIIEPDADELGCLMFAILLNGFKAVGVQTIPQANEIRKTTHVDAILTRTKIVEHAPVPVVVKGNRSMADTVELLKCAVARKRGPRKKGCKSNSHIPLAASAILHNNSTNGGGTCESTPPTASSRSSSATMSL